MDVVTRIAEKQHGIVARYQLLDATLTRSTIDNLVRKGFLQRVALGVYKTPGSQNTWYQRAAIAVLSCGPKAMLSHESALINLGLLQEKPFNQSRKRRPKYLQWKIHVLSSREERFDNDTFYHRSLDVNNCIDAVTCNGIRQVPIERAIIDCAQQLREFELDHVMEKAFSRRLTTPQSLAIALDDIRTAPGREKKRSKEILSHYIEKNKLQKNTESILEKRVQGILRKTVPGLFETQYEVSVNGKMYRLDFAIPSMKIAFEVDGFNFHSNRARFDSDRVRQNDLVNAGWKVVRIISTMSDKQITDLVVSSLVL